METNRKHKRRGGFTLIVTLTLMILLTVVAVGLLTLSSVSLRSTSQGAALASARSNARLALMMALGDLQKALGPDQRISANASSVDPSSKQPNVVGVWDSFGWIAPAGDASMPGDKAAKFRRWLVSAADPETADGFGLPGGEVSVDSVWLSNPATTGTLASNDTTLKAERIPLTVGTNRGGMAWAVSDNSTKASLDQKTVNSADLAMNVANRTSASAPRPDVLADAFKKITEPSKILSMQTAMLAVGAENRKEVSARSEALTNTSVGLLANTVMGGFKTDLTPLFESNANLATVLGNNTPYFASTDGAPSWNYLREHYKLYQKVINAEKGMPRYKVATTDLTTSSSGIKTAPTRESLLPVVAKLQIMFSMVSHQALNVDGRRTALDTNGNPKGNANYATPDIVYDPVITLYNPYDVELQLSKLRIRISDPPVGFQFKKENRESGASTWLRPEFGSGEFHGLARFQKEAESNKDARKQITMYLRNKTASNTLNAGDLVLLPGEVRVFSAWVDNGWNWGKETSGGYAAYAFFDYAQGKNFSNKDGRTGNTKGVETVPGVNFNAGLQTDHLSYENGRQNDTKYAFEFNKDTGANVYPLGQGWTAMKLSDDITVNAKPQRVVSSAALPDFKVDIMSGNNENADSDIVRSYEFRLGDPAKEMAVSGDPAVIGRTFNVGEIFQGPTDTTAGGKVPFGIFSMSAKTTKDDHDDSKAWLFNNMVTEGGAHDSSKVGNALQSYDLSFRSVADFSTFPGIEYDDKNNRGYFGAKATSADGVSVVPMYRVPITPAASLGDWVSANLVSSSQFPRVNYPLGNSFAHPMIPSGGFSTNSPMTSGVKALDHSYLMNAVMWDNYYFSSATNYTTAAFTATRTKDQVLKDFFAGTQPMLNSHLSPYFSGTGVASEIASQYSSSSETDFAKGFAKNAMISGAFNVNSDSVDAWQAVLSSLRDASVSGYQNQQHTVSEKTAFVRTGLPVAGSSDDANPSNSANVLGAVRWAGFRTLTDDQLRSLASLIVEEIRLRGKEDKAPSLCIGDFVNRRLGSSSGLHALKGILQTAIDKSTINKDFHAKDSRTVSGGSLATHRVTGVLNKDALNGFTADGAAPMLTQGDLLTGLAPIITARGDTFTIRAYGESRSGDGGSVVAKAWCEATVQRVPEYVDPNDAADFDVSAAKGDISKSGLSKANQTFGRRFVVTSFRWLSPSEV